MGTGIVVACPCGENASGTCTGDEEEATLMVNDSDDEGVYVIWIDSEAVYLRKVCDGLVVEVIAVDHHSGLVSEIASHGDICSHGIETASASVIGSDCMSRSESFCVCRTPLLVIVTVIAIVNVPDLPLEDRRPP